MKYIRLLFQKLVKLWKWLYYLFSAFTLVLFVAFALACFIWILDIRGLKQDIIMYGYLGFVGVYIFIKTILWSVKIYKKLRLWYDKLFKKHTPIESEDL